MNGDYYRDLLAKHGPTYQAVDAGSEYTHSLRLRILMDMIALPTASILDVGCGVGHLTERLMPNHAYRGIDILPEMIAAAQLKYPCFHFEVGDIDKPKDIWRSDYVLASGLFQFATYNPLLDNVTIMFNLCRKGMACNFLRSGTQNEYVVRPEDVWRTYQHLTPWITIRADYLPNDFTLYLYKEKQG